jgi:hypothetical protein
LDYPTTSSHKLCSHSLRENESSNDGHIVPRYSPELRRQGCQYTSIHLHSLCVHQIFMVSGGDYQVSGNQFHTSWSEVLGDEKAKNDNELLPRLQGKGKPGLYFLKTVVHHPSSISEELPAAGGAFPRRTPRPLICLIYWSATRERKAKTKIPDIVARKMEPCYWGQRALRCWNFG